jgi:hypothetical protein
MYLFLIITILILIFIFFNKTKEGYINQNNITDKIVLKNFTDKIKRKCLTEKDERNEPCLVYYVNYYK